MKMVIVALRTKSSESSSLRADAGVLPLALDKHTRSHSFCFTVSARNENLLQPASTFGRMAHRPFDQNQLCEENSEYSLNPYISCILS